MDLIIKTILVEGFWQSLIMDLNRKGNRILYIASNKDEILSYNEAESQLMSIQRGELCQ